MCLKLFFRRVVFVLAVTNILVVETIKVAYEGFDVLRNTELYVDKSLLIKNFLRRIHSPNSLETCRPTFGKTTNLDMIKRFLEIDIHPNGSMITNKRRHKNYKAFAHTIRSTGNFPEVYKDSEFFTEHFGEYPVIWLDLAADAAGPYDETGFTRQLLNGTLRAAFAGHEYLLNSSVISGEDKKLFETFLNPRPHQNAGAGVNSLSQGIATLRRLLEAHFKRGAIVLVDNLDAPLRQLIFDPKRYSDEALKKLNRFYDVIFEACSKPEKSGEARQTLLTSIIPLDPKNPRLFWKDEFSEYFSGFSTAEVRTLAKLRGMEDDVDGMTAWYGGFGENDTFNPHSVLSYLFSASRELQPYWPELGSLETFKAPFSPDCFGQELIEAFERGEFPLSKAHDRGYFSLENLPHLKHLQNLRPLPSGFAECSGQILDTFLAFLVDLGYFTFKGCVRGSVPVFMIPNSEVKGYMSRIFYESLSNQIPLNADPDFRAELVNATMGLDGSETPMRRFAVILVALLISTEGKSSTPEATLAHSIRVHLLYPLPQLNVRYVRTSRSFNGNETDRPNLDLVFVVEGQGRTVAFVMKIASAEMLSTDKILTAADLNVFSSEEVKSKNEKEDIQLAATLDCDEQSCKFCYFLNDVKLEHEKCVKIIKSRVVQEAKARWKHF